MGPEAPHDVRAGILFDHDGFVLGMVYSLGPVASGILGNFSHRRREKHVRKYFHARSWRNYCGSPMSTIRASSGLILVHVRRFLHDTLVCPFAKLDRILGWTLSIRSGIYNAPDHWSKFHPRHVLLPWYLFIVILSLIRRTRAKDWYLDLGRDFLTLHWSISVLVDCRVYRLAHVYLGTLRNVRVSGHLGHLIRR